MKQQQQKDGGSIYDRGTPRSITIAIPSRSGDHGVGVGRDPRYDAQLPEKEQTACQKSCVERER